MEIPLTFELSGLIVLKFSLMCVATSVYISFFEWSVHKYLMHSLLWSYPFHAHALVHHGLFRADSTYHLQEQEPDKITFAWWNAPIMIIMHFPILVGLSYLFGWSIMAGGLASMFVYYFLYEALHWCMHVPRNRLIEQTRMFRYLNAHHYLHHRHACRNLNVVFPFADWVLGTRMSVSKMQFTSEPHPVGETIEFGYAQEVPVSG